MVTFEQMQQLFSEALAGIEQATLKRHSSNSSGSNSTAGVIQDSITDDSSFFNQREITVNVRSFENIETFTGMVG